MTHTSWLSRIADHSAVDSLCVRLADPRTTKVQVQGSRGSSTALLCGVVAQRTGRPIVMVTAHLDEADDVIEDLQIFSEDLNVRRFGALEVLPGESNVSLELLAERLSMVEDLVQGVRIDVIAAPIQALMQSVPEPSTIHQFALTLRQGIELSPGQLLNWLNEAGYQRVDAIEQPGEFATRGGIVDIYPPAGTFESGQGEIAGGPVRIDYFGDEIESLSLINIDTMGSGQALQQARIVGAGTEQVQSDEDTTNLLSLLPDDAVIIMHELMELTEQARGYYERLTNSKGIYSPNSVFRQITRRLHVTVNQYSGAAADEAPTIGLPVQPLPTLAQDAIEAIGDLAKMSDHDIFVICEQDAERKRLLELMQEHAPAARAHVQLQTGYLHRGFVWADHDGGSDLAGQGESTARPLLLVPHHELFHRYETRRRIRRVSAQTVATDAFFDISVGDYVVHVDHGIAIFTGIKTMRRSGVTQEYLTLQFAQNATLHVPATQIELIQKYIGGFEGKPPLSILGGKRWARQKEQVTEAVKDLAGEMLRLQAARNAMPGIRYPDDTNWQREFEAEFPYEETEDQLSAIAQIKRDMADERPMDRLICGDVGFGKTEVAIRAAFKAVEYGKQVAVLVPTTVLAEQHERTFRQRMADYPFRIESLSRFKTGKEQGKTLEALELGQVDIVIGTHRLLSEDIKFADLGLVIIDEEQRFGVEHKNKLLHYRLTADVLTLSATPIPRTLHMSMLGLRDISSLTTAPLDRRAIVTEVIPYNEKRIQQAIVRELSREGQVYFVHNRVHNIQSVADDILRLVPDARIVIGHGQMPARELEKVMLQFMRREADILVSTTIIESGIDIATANTMIINQADHFGLADLHQLRGRVGRYKHRAYCYLLLPPDRPMNDIAAKRLKAIEQYSMLGAGFKIAMRDLEIRGAGNLLGKEQSGNIAAVGYEMYCHLLEQETRRLNNEKIVTPVRTHLELPVVGQIPKRYITSDKYRMETYRRMSRAVELDQLEDIVRDMTEAYGPIPPKAQELIDITELRIAASHMDIDSIKLEGPDLIFKTDKAGRLDAVFRNAPGRTTLIDNETIYWRPPANYFEEMSTLLAVLRKLIVRPVREAGVDGKQ